MTSDYGTSQVVLVVKNPPVDAGDRETLVLFLGQEDPPEKEIGTHSSIFAWEIPRTEESGRLQSMGVTKSRTRLKDFTFTLSVLITLLLVILSCCIFYNTRLNIFKYCSKIQKLLWEVKITLSCLFATPGTIAHKASLSMGFPRQEYWRGWPFPSPRDLPDPGIEPGSSALQADALPSSHQGNQILSLLAASVCL